MKKKSPKSKIGTGTILEPPKRARVHRVQELVDDGCGITLVCACGFETEGTDCAEAGRAMDKHFDKSPRVARTAVHSR